MMSNCNSKLPDNVYLVFSKNGNREYNSNTGTRIYTRKSNAVRKATRGSFVVEYELVPTGRIFSEAGEEQ